MNKIIAIIVAVLVIGGGAVYVITSSGDDNNITVSNEEETQDIAVGDEVDYGDTKGACDVFTESIAQRVVGEGAALAELPAGAEASTDDIAVSNCIFDDGTDNTDGVIASVLVRAAKTETGATTNDFGLSSTKEETATSIDGVGDEAFWNPQFGQANALVDGGKYWIIASVSQGTNSYDQTRSTELLKLIVAEL